MLLSLKKINEKKKKQTIKKKKKISKQTIPKQTKIATTYNSITDGDAIRQLL